MIKVPTMSSNASMTLGHEACDVEFDLPVVLEVFILLQCKTTPRIRPTKTRNGMYG
jgi:hypothetical protein